MNDHAEQQVKFRHSCFASALIHQQFQYYKVHFRILNSLACNLSPDKSNKAASCIFPTLVSCPLFTLPVDQLPRKDIQC